MPQDTAWKFSDAMTTFNPVAPIDELTGYLQSMGSPVGALNPNNPMGQAGQGAEANKANPKMNPVNPNAFNNPSNPQLNPDLPGSATNPANPQYNPSLPGAQNNPANPQFNQAFPTAINRPSSPELNPIYPGSWMNPSAPMHNPDYPNPSAIGQPPPTLGPNASFPPSPGMGMQSAVGSRRFAWTPSVDGVGDIPDVGDAVGGSVVWEMDNLTTHLEDGRALPLEEAQDLREGSWHSAAGAYDYYYHVSPRSQRERIQQHGLHPSVPSEANYPPDRLDAPSSKMERQPAGVYVTKSPRAADTWRGVTPTEIGQTEWGPMFRDKDVWRIPRTDVQDVQPDAVERNAWYITHPVPNPELYQPGTHEEDSMWRDHDTAHGYTVSEPIGGFGWEPRYHPEWGIGKPNRVWGKTAVMGPPQVVEHPQGSLGYNGRRPMIWDPSTNQLHVGPDGSTHWDVIDQAQPSEASAHGWIGPNPEADWEDVAYNRGQPHEVGWRFDRQAQPSFGAHQMATELAQQSRAYKRWAQGSTRCADADYTPPPGVVEKEERQPPQGHQLWYTPGERVPNPLPLHAVNTEQGGRDELAWGRGWFHKPNGTLHTWPEWEATHSGMGRRLWPDDYGWSGLASELHAIGISPEGEVRDRDMDPRGFAEIAPQIQAADPRLKPVLEERWGKTAGTWKQWQPGEFGKGFITPTNRVVHWRTDGPDGRPAHRDALALTGYGSPAYMAYGGPEAHNFFEVSPEGYVVPSGLQTPEGYQQIVQSHPAFTDQLPEQTNLMQRSIREQMAAHPEFDWSEYVKQFPDEERYWTRTADNSSVVQEWPWYGDERPHPSFMPRRPLVWDPDTNQVHIGPNGMDHGQLLRGMPQMPENGVSGWLGYDPQGKGYDDGDEDTNYGGWYGQPSEWRPAVPDAVHQVIQTQYPPEGYQVGRRAKTADNYTNDSRNFPDPTEPRSSMPPAPKGCSCDQGLKLECPVHGLHPTDADYDLSWSVPQGNPVGYPQSGPRTWPQATESSTSWTQPRRWHPICQVFLA